jgi:hypothetical protein
LGVRHPQSGSRRSARSVARTNGLEAGEDGAILIQPGAGGTVGGVQLSGSSVCKIIFKASAVARDDARCRSKNGSKNAMGSGRTGWTGWDARDGRPWPGRTPRNPVKGMGRVPFAS